jgi:peptidoglycan/LPS O-acetylase OafA/YrhL
MGIIRILLALELVIYHLPESSIFNYLGMNGSVVVKTFFIISGFYMALVINEKYFVKEKKTYFLFFSNRYLKLYPAYFVTLIFAIFVSYLGFLKFGNWIYLNSYFVQNLSIPSLLIITLINLSMFGIAAISFFSINPVTGQLFFTATPFSDAINYIFIGQAWAISIELIFYLVAPFILRKKTSILIGLLAASLLLRIILCYFGYYNNPWADRFFPTELAFFMLGAIAYKVYSNKKFLKKINSYFYLIPIIVISGIIFYQYIPDVIYFYFSLKEWLFFVIFSLSLPILFLLSNKMKKIDRFFAELSYPVFLSHVVILNLVAIFINFNLDSNLGKTCVIGLTIVYSVFIVIWVMDPIEKIRQKRIQINLIIKANENKIRKYEN